ncbi:2-amino-4-hydroxy-6-hydroxymethyldihydropteridine diphosphokinase [Chloroflexota bacterium]
MNVELVTAYLCLGSNMGDREDNLKKGLEYLSQRTRLTQKSSIYETEPEDNPQQPHFLNMVCQVKTMLKAEDLLVLLKAIERKQGRLPGRKNAPRPIDIDILFYGDSIIDTKELTIPHPRLTRRAFVLVPLVEIAPALIHPVAKKTVTELLKELERGVQGVMKLGGKKG